jgi:hypothetical protein
MLRIEDEYTDSALNNLKIEDYDLNTTAYHCKLLWEAGLVDSYKPLHADNALHGFFVGSLTWSGHEFLDQIRNDSFWSKTKETIKSKGIPFAFDVIKSVATALVTKLVVGL